MTQSHRYTKGIIMQSTQQPGTRTVQKESDVINLILEDHKPLKKLIKILKDNDKDFDKRDQAFAEFAPLLINHSKSEEESLYKIMKTNAELRTLAFEGDVEHTLADQMLEEIKRTEDQDIWSAKVKVLAELVEHHIEEEEEEMLPEYKKESTLEERARLGQHFLTLKTKMAEQGNEDSPSEARILQ